MNCHKGKSNKMMLLCLLPILAFVVIRFSGYEFGSMANFLPFMLFLLCPLMHFGMFYFMFKGRNNKEENQGDTEVAACCKSHS